jgi:hypothetical protein
MLFPLAQTAITFDLTTVSGIGIVTVLIVESLKRSFTENKGLGRIPVSAMAAVTAAGLSFLANKVLYVNGHPLLQGDWHEVIWKSVLSALQASGAVAWIKNGTTSLAEAQPIGSPPPIKAAAVEKKIEEAADAIDAAKQAGISPTEKTVAMTDALSRPTTNSPPVNTPSQQRNP